MSTAFQLNLPGVGGGRSASPLAAKPRETGFVTPKKKQKNTFPSTPRSVEKQKKILQARLKRLMEANLRLTATNKMLKGQNK